jgi:uncharacterized RDD family membrane protein YckC
MSHVFQPSYTGSPWSIGSAAYSARHDPCQPRYSRRVSTPRAERGTRLGLPADGPGSLAATGPRIAAFVLDLVLSSLVAGLFTAPELPRLWSLLAFACEYVFFAATFAQTPGMALLRLGLARVDMPGEQPVRPGIGRVALRTLLLILLVPAVVTDSDGRGLHDRASGTAVLRLR